MATDAERSIQVMQKAVTAFADDMVKADKASKGIAQNFDQFTRQVTGQHHTITDYLRTAVKLPRPFEEVSRALVTPRQRMQAFLGLLEDQYRQARAAGEQNVQNLETLIRLEKARITLKDNLHAITGKQLAVEYLMIRGFYEAIKRSGEVNEALMQANSLSQVREDLTREIYQVQAQTGASLQNMLGASKALAAVFPKARSDFKSTLEVIVQMEEGLGVSFEHSAELARVFQINLKTPVREVADQIAVIANSTSLAADDATRFATEIGKALRLLGPGAASGAREVTGYVTALAGRMKDVGGDANEIVKLFTEMQRGTSQGFMLRGIAGVGAPGALGTQAGAQQAMQGIGRMIDRIVTAAPGTAAFTAQLEAASQVLGTTTETVLYYKDAIAAANKPLDEHARLTQRWQEQITNANKSIQRVRESFVALIQQAFLPIIPYVSRFLNAIARLVSFIASSRPAIIITGTVLAAVAIKTVISLYKLSAAILQVAAASELAARIQAARGVATEAGFFGRLASQLPWLGRIHAGIMSVIGAIGKVGRFLVSPPALAAMIGAAIGVSLGLLFNKMFPKLAKDIGEGLYHVFYRQQVATITPGGIPGQKSVYQIMAEIRREALRGNMDQAMKIFEEGKYNVKGLQSEAGARAYLDFFVKTMAEVRERIGLSTATQVEDKTLKQDRQLIDLTKQQVDNSQEYLRQAREGEKAMKELDARRQSEAAKQRMQHEAEFRLHGDGALPRKTTLGFSSGLGGF